MVSKFWCDRGAQSVLEYVLISALITSAMVIAMKYIAQKGETVISKLNASYGD